MTHKGSALQMILYKKWILENQGYSSLSWLARQAYLMQSELPTALNVFDTDYQLDYSESYSGTVHQEIAIEEYQYCISLQRAFWVAHIWKATLISC